MRHYPCCEHPQRTDGRVCPVCLRTNWNRAAAAVEQANLARQLLAAARKERARGPSGGASASDPGNDPGRRRRDAGPVDGEPQSMEYVLPPLAEVLKLTQPRSPGTGQPAVSQIYVWGYAPLHTDFWQRQAQPTAAAREFAATHGWDAMRPGAWAVELVLPLSLSRALGTLEPAIRRDPAIRGWGGRRGSLGYAPPPPRAALSAAASQRLAAQLLCERAVTLTAVVSTANARLQQLTLQVRSGRLQRLKRLPPAEFDALNRTLTAALALGKQGRLAEGYALLLSSWHEATAAGQQRIPWSGSLRWIYGLALQNYAWRYGPSLE
jgi:hypothetical protein